VLADFGLVTVGEHTQGRIGAASQDHKGGVVRWTAPEIMRGDKKSPASDVYAFACICLAVCAVFYLETEKQLNCMSR
jgi:serine/threonine protein kinase